RRERSTSFIPTMRSSSATCFETAGWLMLSSAAAAENDLRRANAANARKRASSSITLAYTNEPIMYFFSSSSQGSLLRIGDANEAQGHGQARLSRRGLGICGNGQSRNSATPDVVWAAGVANCGEIAAQDPIVRRSYRYRP